MKKSGDTNRGSTKRDEPELEAAIEKCIVKLEQGEAQSIDSVISEFPHLETELREFLVDWGGMEGFVARISDSIDDDPVYEPNIAPKLDGKLFGDFELIEKIGEGGMGVIYKARQISLNRIVALKMILGDRADRERFRLEAEAIAALAHPNIVSIYEIGECSGRLFFTMQFVEGHNLKQFIERNRIEAKEAARITETIARAVHYAHQRGILHRDLKPANILMDVDGQPHITDFGLAKHIERDSELTNSGTIMGTPGYMAPEQASGKIKNLTAATDVYGLGAILYALLTGEAPFTGKSTLEIIRQVSEQPPKSPRLLVPELDLDIETLSLKCLEKTPEHRYRSAEELAEDLARFRSGSPVLARPVPGFEKAWRWCRRNPLVAGLSAAAIFLLLATTASSVLLAISERNARINSERNAKRELSLKNEVDAALVEERKTKSALHLANGIWRAETGDIPGALLWFAESARGSVEDPAQLESQLRRWNSWYASHPRLIAATLLSEGYREVEKGGWDRVEFRSSENEVLIQAGSKFVVWNFQRDTVWDLNHICGEVASATWNSRGDELAVGCVDGRVLKLNPDQRSIVDEIKTDSAVTQIAYSDDCRRLAIANSNELKVFDRLLSQPVELPEHRKNIVYIKFSPSGEELVTVALDRKARLFNVENSVSAKFESRVYRTKPTEYNQPFRPTFVHQGRSLLLRTNRNEYRMFDVISGKQIDEIEIDQRMYSFAIQDDWLVMAGEKEAQLRRIAGAPEEITNLVLRDENPAQQETKELLSEPLSQMLHTYLMTNCDMSKNGLVATGCWDQNVRIWEPDVSDGNALPNVVRKHSAILPHQTRIRKVRFSPDSRYLITIQIDGLVRIFDLMNSKTDDYVIDSPTGANFLRMVGPDHLISTGASYWFSKNTDVEMRRFDSPSVVASTKPLNQAATNGILMDAICALNGRSLITLHSRKNRSRTGFLSKDGSAGRVCFWSWPDCSQLENEIELDSEPRWIEHHPLRNQVAICTSNMDVVLIDTERQEIETVLVRDAARFSFEQRYSHFPQHAANQQLKYSPDGKTVLVWSQYNVGGFVWDLDREKLRFDPFENQGWPISAAEFSHDGKYIVFAGGRSKDVTIIDAMTGKQVGKTLKHTVVCYNAHFNPDSTLVVTACRDGQARVFDWRTGDLIHNDLKHTADVLDAAFSPDSKYVLTIGVDRKLKVWNADDGSISIRPIEISRGARHVKVASDGRHAIVFGGLDFNNVVKLTDDELPQVTNVGQAILFSQFIANHRIKGSASVKINTDQWYADWQKYKSRRFDDSPNASEP